MADHGFDLEAIERKMGGHSIFAPSYSSTWLYCAGSLIPSLEADDTAGVDAAYGTVGHGVGEMWLKTGVRPSHLIGTIEKVDEGHEIFSIEIDEPMLSYVQEYVDWCQMVPGDHFVEQRVYFSQITPIKRQGGTADHIACAPGVMTITDLKLGKGVQVFATGNTQARLYALGAFYEHDWQYNFQRIIIRIAQPRLNHFDTWEITREELLEFAEWAKERAYMAWDPKAKRTPGEKQCQWCRIRKNCLSAAAFAVQITEGDFDDLAEEVDVVKFIERLDDDFDEFAIKPVNVQDLTLAQKSKLNRYRKMVENTFKAIEDDLEKQAAQGVRIPGMKMVEGRSTRFFADEKKVVDELTLVTNLPETEFYNRSLLSPAKVEELLVKKGGVRRKDLPLYLKDLTVKPRGKPVLAPAHDKRKEVSVSDDDAFDDLSSDDGL